MAASLVVSIIPVPLFRVEIVGVNANVYIQFIGQRSVDFTSQLSPLRGSLDRLNVNLPGSGSVSDARITCVYLNQLSKIKYMNMATKPLENRRLPTPASISAPEMNQDWPDQRLWTWDL